MIKLHAWASFDSGNYNGKGYLTDATSCVVTEEVNGIFELCMQYPVWGNNGTKIQERDVIEAKPDNKREAQPFRIYRITRPINGIITIYACHISYDLLDIPVEPFSASSVSASLAFLKSNMAYENKFTMSGDVTNAKHGTLSFTEPKNARSILMGESDSITSTFFTSSKGQIFFDWYDIRILDSRGTDRGVKIEYGENLTKYVKETNRTEFYNGIYPYAKNNDGSLLTLSEKIVMQSSVWPYKKIAVVDLSRQLSEKELTENNLRTAAVQYMSENGFGEYSVTMDISFVNLKDTAEYSKIKEISDVRLGDIITVIMPLYGEETKEIVTKTAYDVLTGKYNTVSVGKLRKGIR